jgi:hypothetical protein
MKEKITVIIVLTSAVALLFHHHSRNNNTQLTSIQEDVSIQLEVSISPKELEEDGLELPQNEALVFDECIIDPITTDNLTFKDAFSHFRKCLGSNQEFSWKGQAYLTAIAEEVENVNAQIADSTLVENPTENEGTLVTR